MIDKVIYSVVWWDGTQVKTENFLESENAETFERNAREDDTFIASGRWKPKTDFEYKAAAKKCIDYEPPKKR